MPLVKGRCIADRVIKWILNYKKHNVMLYKTIKHLKKIINYKINYSVVVLNDDQLDYLLLRFILGESRHSKYTEPFYCDTILPITFNKTLEVNIEGKIMNLRCNDTSVQFDWWPRSAKDFYIIIIKKKIKNKLHIIIY
jgi:hypothetical protein